MKKVTITNAYTWYNKGDAGILLGIVNAMKKMYNDDVEINVLSFTPEEDKKRYCKDTCIKDVKSNILNPFPFKHSKVGKLVAVLKLVIRMLYLLTMMKFSMKYLIKKEESFRLMSESDMIIVCGGGFLGGKKFDSLMHLFQIYANTKFDIPVYIMGTSIEPIKSKIIKYYTESVIKKVNYTYARETITYQYLSTFLNKEKYDLIPDMAFMLEDIKEDSSLVNNFKKNHEISFGITVRKWSFPNLDISQEEAMKNYCSAIANVMSTLIEQKNAGFIFIPQVIVSHADDTDIARNIRDLLPENYRKDFLILENDLSPIEIKTLIGNLDYFIGTRMHSNIFATSMKKPTVAIAYEKKTNGIMETVGLNDYIVEMDEITSEGLLSTIYKSMENRKSIVNNLEKRIPEIRMSIISKMKKIL